MFQFLVQKVKESWDADISMLCFYSLDQWLTWKLIESSLQERRFMPFCFFDKKNSLFE